MAALQESMDAFVASSRFAVAGASDNPDKYGNIVFVALQKAGCDVVPLNPNAATVMGVPAYANLAALPQPVEALSIVTPPAVTEKIVAEALQASVKRIWMQPGAESAKAIETARMGGIDVIAGGPCILVELSKRRRKK